MHNDVRAKGKGRSVQRRHKRLKFENVLTVVPLLFLAHTSIASLTDDSASKAAKIVVRPKIVSVRAEGHVSQQSSTPEGRVFSVSGNVPEVSSLWLWSGWIDYVVIQRFSRSITISFLCFTINSVLLFLLVLCEVSVQVFLHVHVQAKNSNRTTLRAFSNFNLCVVVACSFPFFSLLRHYALLMLWIWSACPSAWRKPRGHS